MRRIDPEPAARPAAPAGAPRRRLRAIAWIGAGLAAAATLPALGSARAEWRAFHPRRGPISLVGDEGIPGLAPFRLAGGTAGWYAASRTGAAVIVAHGSEGDRRSGLAEARILAAAGHGVLLFDWPGHGESPGRVALGAPERAALREILDWLAARPDVRGGRIGLIALSAGVAPALEVARADRRVRAVAVAGGFTDSAALVRHQYRRWGFLSWGPALAVDWWHLRRVLRPVDDVAALGRPLLVVAGAEDPVVPPAMAEALHAAAQEPRALVLLPRAGHCDYAAAAPEAYARALTEFFARL